MTKVIKRDGTKEPLDIDKIHKIVMFACEDVTGVSASEIELHAKIQFYDGIQTSELQETLIKSAADLISADTPNYQWVAGRLVNFHIRKQVYGQYEPWHLYELIQHNVKAGFYDMEILHSYTKAEFNKANSYIKHSRDDTFTYAAMEQFRGKYLVQNRVTKQLYETPQMAYMMIALTLFQNYPKAERMKWVKEYYNAISSFDISLPTPIMAGVRTPQRQFSSCVVINCGDSLDSINATSSAIVKYVSQKAGIGINGGAIRALGSTIRNGDAYHTGMIPFFKLFQAATRSCSQGGVRNGAATVHYPIWHLEVEDLLVLKNNKGTEDNRVRHLDYSVQINKLMYERLLEGKDITLFSPSDVPGLYDSFFSDQNRFKVLYERAEKHPNIRKKTIKAVELFSMLIEERKNTGRIYIQNVDHANTHGSFIEKLAPIQQSNLCLTGDTQVDVCIEGGEPETKTLKSVIDLVNQGKDVHIKSKKHSTDKIGYKPILAAAMTAKNAELMHIEDTESGYSIKCTPDHEIYTQNRGYIKAKRLKETDTLSINTYKYNNTIYCITNKVNNKKYIGMTSRSLKNRWNSHCSSARNDSPFRFHSAIRKYGEQSFTIEALYEGLSIEDARKIEEQLIDKYNTTILGYNAKPGGCGGWIVPENKYKKWKADRVKLSTLENNGNWSGYSDEFILDSCVTLFNSLQDKKEFSFAGILKMLRQEYPKIPKSFSKNRFKEYNHSFKQGLSSKLGISLEDLEILARSKSDAHREKLRLVNTKGVSNA